MSKWLLACKELNGSVYVTRLPRTILNANGSSEPGVPDNWFFVGPGTAPSVEAYSAVSVNITATSVAANTLTVTCANSFSAGQTVLLEGTAEAFLNGQILSVATASPTQFTAIFTHANYTNNSDTGTASFNQFILVFSYLSRLIVRVLDINVWPPNEVNPISVGGGPNPPNAFLYQITSFSPPTDTGLLNENLIFQVPASNMSAVQVRNQYDPPYLAHNLIFFNATTNTYSVLLQPDPTWITNIPNTTNFFRLYRSPLGPNPTWTRIEDWNTTFASSGFTDSQVGSLQFQYSASIGAYFNPAAPQDPAQHEESFMGPPLAFDSNQHPLGFLLTPADVMGLVSGQFVTSLPGNAAVAVSTTQRFFVQVVADIIENAGLQPLGFGRIFGYGFGNTGVAATPLQDTPTSATCSVGGRAGFVVVEPLPSDPIDVFPGLVTPTTSQPSVMPVSGNATCTVYA